VQVLFSCKSLKLLDCREIEKSHCVDCNQSCGDLRCFHQASPSNAIVGRRRPNPEKWPAGRTNLDMLKRRHSSAISSSSGGFNISHIMQGGNTTAFSVHFQSIIARGLFTDITQKSISESSRGAAAAARGPSIFSRAQIVGGGQNICSARRAHTYMNYLSPFPCSLRV
jgi:hypothetical protein